MPLLYNALEAEQPVVQERALKTVPRLCEVLEYSHVKERLFPAVSTLFSKTKVGTQRRVRSRIELIRGGSFLPRAGAIGPIDKMQCSYMLPFNDTSARQGD